MIRNENVDTEIGRIIMEMFKEFEQIDHMKFQAANLCKALDKAHQRHDRLMARVKDLEEKNAD